MSIIYHNFIYHLAVDNIYENVSFLSTDIILDGLNFLKMQSCIKEEPHPNLNSYEIITRESITVWGHGHVA